MTIGDRLRSWLRIALAATSACLAMGLVASLMVSGPAAPVADALIWTGLGLLVSIPVLNVVAVYFDEWVQPRRTFAWAALVVLVLVVWTIVRRL
jgi:hypothetical protein